MSRPHKKQWKPVSMFWQRFTAVGDILLDVQGRASTTSVTASQHNTNRNIWRKKRIGDQMLGEYNQPMTVQTS